MKYGFKKEQRIGYTTLNGFIRILKKQNKILKSLGMRAKFEIELPIRGKK